MRNKNRYKLVHKQKGATLFTALVFLTLMTIVSVSATKLSILDVLMAGNNQQRMQLYQETANDLVELTTVIELYKPLVKTPGHLFDPETGIYSLPKDSAKPHVEMQITDPGKTYSCKGFNGQATSIGPSVPPCDLYDFQVKSTKASSSVKDRHNRGAGKEKPNAKKNSYL
jgi:hypothetical protein